MIPCFFLILAQALVPSAEELANKDLSTMQGKWNLVRMMEKGER